MIVGIGNDICDIGRIADSIERNGQRFLDRVYAPAEQDQGGSDVSAELSYAKLFAAKEALAKALGTGITSRVRWTDIVITAPPGGELTVSLTNGAARRARRLAGSRQGYRLHLSVAADETFAYASAIFERD